MKKTTSRINLSQVISRLQQDLKQYFYYPRLARRKNIQGAVILGFAINRLGEINNIRIVKSSGFAVLDIAAEDALRQLDQLHWEQGYLQRNNQHIELPVIYQLTES
ncbi:MAG: energy transducer TonB [Gammaproteobacteria bacterium]|nr:energy transducer TonB [Gammaproteobacteria bacterium]